MHPGVPPVDATLGVSMKWHERPQPPDLIDDKSVVVVPPGVCRALNLKLLLGQLRTNFQTYEDPYFEA